MPQRYWDVLTKNDDDILTPEEEGLLHERIKLKILIVARNDKLYLFNKYFEKYLPGVLKNIVELNELQGKNIKAAIQTPAILNLPSREFVSKPFEFSPSALAKIIDFLTLEGREGVDSTHLQIICQEIERRLINNNRSIVSPELLGDLDNIIENYYFEKIKSIGTLEEQNAAKRLLKIYWYMSHNKGG